MPYIEGNPTLIKGPSMLTVTPALTKSLLASLSNPALTFHDVADRFQIDVEDFALWVMQPEIQARLAVIQQAMECHARVVAAAALPSALRSQVKALDELNAQPTATDNVADDPKLRALHARERDQARKAATLILKFTKPPAAPKSSAGSTSPTALSTLLADLARSTHAETQPGFAPSPEPAVAA